MTATKQEHRALPAEAPQGARPGYKHTKLGWIPEEWEVTTISEVCNVVRGSSPRPAGSPLYFNGHAMPWLTVSEITNLPDSEKRVTTTASKLTELGVQFSRVLEPDTLVLANSGATLGVPKVLAIRACANDGVAALLDIDREKLEQDYLYYILQRLTKHYREVVAPGNGQPNLNTELIGGTLFNRPSLTEQRHIAQVLGAWDRDIATVQQLLAAQQERKRGLMQELLTGRRRFKGFGGKWRECELGELGQFRTSSVDKKLVEGQKRVRLVNYMDVYNNQRIHGSMPFMEVTAKDSQLQSSSLRRGDILFTPSSETPDDIGHSAVVVDDMDNTLFSYHVMRFRPHDDALDLDFRAYVFNNARILKQFSARATGSTRYTLSASDFGDTLVSFPSDKAEQQAIARTLMACDAESDTLTNQLDHLTTQKRGLMQQLLTGAVRVKH
jgi:type I restriction enzyme S subunit